MNSKKTVKNPSRTLLVRAMAADAELHKLVNAYIVKCVKQGREYQLQLAFWSSTSVWTMTLMKDRRVNEEDIIDRFISDISEVISLSKHSEAQIASYMILSVLGSITRLSSDVLNAAIKSVVFNWTNEVSKSGLACVTQLAKGFDDYTAFEKSTWDALSKEAIVLELINIGREYNVTKFTTIFLVSIFQHNSWNLLNKIPQILDETPISDSQLQVVIESALAVTKESPFPANLRAPFTTLFNSFLKTEERENIVKEALDVQDITFYVLELVLQTSLNSKTLAAASYPAQSVEVEQVITTSATVEAQLEALKETDVDSFFDATHNSVFEERGALFSSAVDRIQTADDLSSLLKLKDTQIPSFLARVWTGVYPSLVRAHAFKLVQQHISSKPYDYQGLIPLIFVGLFDNSERVRKLALHTLKAISKSYSTLSGDFEVWGLNDIFGTGEKSSEVKWMSIDNVNLFLSQHIFENSEEITVNVTKIFTVLQDFFKSEEKASKKAASEFFAVLASQAIYCKIPSSKSYLLRLVNVSSKTRSKYLAPLLKSWFDDRSDYSKLARASNFLLSDLENEVFGILSTGERNLGINFLESAIKSGITTVGEKATQKIIELWSGFRQETQFQLLKLLIDQSLDDSSLFDSSDIFAGISITAPVFELILVECTLESSSAAARNAANGASGSASPVSVAKRRRRSSGAAKQLLQTGEMAQFAERHLRRTTLVLEILEKNKPTGNTHILSQLFTILSEILTLGADSKLPVEYTEQVLANCMIHIVNDLKTQPDIKLDASSMRIDILVSCIRTSGSQQVQNRFLLLVANMAPMASDAVLHGVMPIFTFMGANTIRQDDEFSAYVIQHTISQVIPSLLCDKTQNKDEEIDFLFLSFVAAFFHIPRHRRVRLYSTLVKTLGTDTLYRMVFLLAEKYHEAKLKRKSTEAKALWQFSNTFISGFSVVDQITMIEKYLDFLNLIPTTEPSSEERKEGTTPFLRRQIFHSISNLHTPALLTLRGHLVEYLSLVISNDQTGTLEIDPLRISVGRLFKEKSLVEEQKAVQANSEKSIALILENLINVKSLKANSNVAESVRAVTKAFYTSLDCVLELLPIEVFVSIFRDILLNSSDNKIRSNALALVRSKFEMEAYVNEDANEAAREAFDSIVELVNVTDSEDLLQMSFDALDRIVAKYWEHFDPKELLKLLDIVVGPKGLNHPNVDILVSSVGVINSVCSAIGARSIGHFSKIIPVLFSKFESSLSEDSSASEDDSKMIQISTFALVANLVQRLPAFMASSLVKILKLSFISTIDVDTRYRVLESLAQHIDSKKLLKAYTEAWSFAVNANWDSINLFIVSLDNLIGSVERRVVSSLANSLIGFLLKAFEARTLGTEKYDANTYNRIEMSLVKTGLHIVMKLNDKTFRPLFVRMVRWAIDGEDSSPELDSIQRRVIFFKFVSKMFGSLKSIVTSYFGYLVDATCDILDEYTDSKKRQALVGNKAANALRTAIFSSLAVSFQYDREEFWQASARFDKISTSLLEQYATIDPNQGKALVKAVVSLAETVNSQEQYKAINDGIMKHLKESCSVNEKIWGIRTLKGLYAKLGEEWVPMLNPLVPLIAELLEDDDESVVHEVTKNLTPVVEEVLGESLDRYLS